ncbi:RdRp [Hubei permutotetra-like virus 8]|uniref:RdRp n=1 Tax=Hubei permutotetra-like virus 8 TaxID=1923082 RepID=UPI00090C03BC|nr:RdRp [Hubei permutotetra-like virus 8]APG76960.1 RdRp [Hubei permutotetra-like virus 8]
MTDCSNPIVDHSRVPFGNLEDVAAVRLRQDLGALRALLETSVRETLPAPEHRVDWEGRVKADISKLNEGLKIKVESGVLDIKKNTSLVEYSEHFPVSGLRHEGQPVHPAGVHQKEGWVTTQRTFGGNLRRIDEVQAFLRVFEPEEMLEAATQLTYTRGTAKGFETRIEKLVTRKCKSVLKYPYVSKDLNSAVKRLRELLPLRKGSLLPDWGGTNLEDLLETIQTTARASAGAPYWKDKCDAKEQLLFAGLPELVEALNKEDPKAYLSLFDRDPEMFLCECKNKLDRYETSKLDTKCRPYFSIPYHCSVLFSILSQNFSDNLELCHEGDGANAYGLVWAHGGATKLAEWVDKRTKYQKPTFYCYGDDTDFYWRDQAGELWRASPDFVQMDGSVDRDCVRVAVEYIYTSFAEQHGQSRFWRRVCDLWIAMATDPLFIIHGPTVYRKPTRDGLASGVVGTTFFDTCKAVLSYSSFLDHVTYNNMHSYAFKQKTSDKFEVEEYMLDSCGLEIKQGTWVPNKVCVQPQPGNLFCDSKFLGVYLQWRQGPEKVELVPWLPEEDWLKTILNPRDLHEDEVNKKPQDYRSIIRQRTTFDRARGYLITGAFSNERVRDALFHVLNSVDPVAVCMEVAGGGGKGEQPEISNGLGNFQYHDSSGVPTQKWCENLYFTSTNQWQGDKLWLQPFGAVADKIGIWKREERVVNPRLTVKHGEIELVGKKELVEVEPPPVLSAGLTQVKKLKHEKPVTFAEALKKPNVRSELRDPVTKEKPKHSGTDVDHFLAWLNEEKKLTGSVGMPGVPLVCFRNAFGLSWMKAKERVFKAGFLIQGRDQWIVPRFVSGLDEEGNVQKQVSAAKTLSEVVGPLTKGAKQVLQKVPVSNPLAAALKPKVEVSWVEDIDEKVYILKGLLQASLDHGLKGLSLSEDKMNDETFWKKVSHLKFKDQHPFKLHLVDRSRRIVSKEGQSTLSAVFFLEMRHKNGASLDFSQLGAVKAPLLSVCRNTFYHLLREKLRGFQVEIPVPKAAEFKNDSQTTLLTALSSGVPEENTAGDILHGTDQTHNWGDHVERQDVLDKSRPNIVFTGHFQQHEIDEALAWLQVTPPPSGEGPLEVSRVKVKDKEVLLVRRVGAEIEEARNLSYTTLTQEGLSTVVAENPGFKSEKSPIKNLIAITHNDERKESSENYRKGRKTAEQRHKWNVRDGKRKKRRKLEKKQRQEEGEKEAI